MISNDANQLISEICGLTNTNYAYDPNGNLTVKTDPTGTTIWLYDYENKQISYTDSLNKGFYSYDAGGRRIGHTSIITTLKSGGSQNAASKIGVGNGKGKGAQNGQGTQNAIANQYETITTTERYILDGANVIADYNLVSGIWNLTASYVTPFLDQNLLISRGGNTYYFQADGLGSVRNLLDSTQSVQNSYDYTAFGEALNWSETIPNRYTYTSREWDSESSTYHYRSRSYNPSVGRFIGRDKLEYYGGINLYAYVRSNPILLTDPNGYMTQEACNKVIENDIFGKGPNASTDAWRLYESMMERCRGGKKECCVGQPTSQAPGSTPNISCGSNTKDPCNKLGVRGESSRDEKGYPQIVLCYDKFNDIPGSTPGSVGTTASQACSQVLLHELTHASQDCFGLAVITPPDPIYQVPTKPNEATWPSCGDVVCSEIQAYCSSGEYNSSSKDLYEAVKRSIKSGKTYQACNSDDDNIKAAFDANLDRCCGSKPKGWDWHRPSCKK